MDDRSLEVLATGTASVVLVATATVLATLLSGSLQTVLPAIGTIPATMLFGYLWLLALVTASQVEVTFDGRGVVETAAAGGAVGLVYLTVILIIGFVAPVPDLLNPAARSVSRLVVIGVGGGGIVGGALGVLFAGARRAGKLVVE